MGRVYNEKAKNGRIPVFLTSEGYAEREGERRSHGQSPRRKADVSRRHRALSFIPWTGVCVAPRGHRGGWLRGADPLMTRCPEHTPWAALRGEGTGGLTGCKFGPTLTAPQIPCFFVRLSVLPPLPGLSVPESSVLTGRYHVGSGTGVVRQTVAGPLRLRKW